MTKIVGIINITPDSFSDGGDMNPDAALQHVADMISYGVDVIDIGAESTRPGAAPVSPQGEWQRLEIILHDAIKCCGATGVVVSVDTRHAETAKQALNAGVDWINDVSGFRDPEMIEVVRSCGCRLVVMHSMSIPADPNIVLRHDKNAVDVLLEWGNERLQSLESEGIARERVVIDPGIGFGKTAEQSLEIIRNIDKLQELGAPLLVGHSRKSFLKKFSAAEAAERDSLTLLTSIYLRQQGVDFLRIHNVTEHNEGFALWDNLCAEK